MRIIRNVHAVESLPLDDGDVAFADKPWICDPWIRGVIATRADAIDEAAIPEPSSELSPPLMPEETPGDWSPRRTESAPPEEE